MKNFKLLLKSLISNNACIDGGRTKKWFVAIIMFFLSLVVAIVPVFVLEIRKNGDDIFDNISYGVQEATYDFNKYLIENDISMKVKYIEQSEEKTLVVTGMDDHAQYPYTDASGKTIFTFNYSMNEISEDEYNQIKGDGNTGFVIFTGKSFYAHIVNPNNGNLVADLNCVNAYKHLDDGYEIKDLYVAGGQKEQIDATWNNWKVFYKKAYDYNRLRNSWMQTVIFAVVDFTITLLMGFMIWILTRGKNNPYRSFGLWETQKIAYWASFTPALLTCGFGFLFTNFARALFPLMLGIRVMWLSMKSLRPDGSGYAAN